MCCIVCSAPLPIGHIAGRCATCRRDTARHCAAYRASAVADLTPPTHYDAQYRDEDDALELRRESRGEERVS